MGLLRNKYQLIRLGNRHYPQVVMWLIGAAGWLGVLLFGGGIRGANLCLHTLSSGANLKASLRRIAWYAKQGWMHLRLIDDPNFDITEGLNGRELEVLDAFLARRIQGHSNPNLLSDRLFLDAHILHKSAQEGRMDTQAHERFFDTAHTILQSAAHSMRASHARTTPVAQPEQSSSEVFSDFPKLAQRILELFAAHLPLEHYPWYVVSGTFLGLHRENGFLPHDYDIDLGINAHEINIDAIINHLESLPEHTIKSIYTIPRIQIAPDGIRYVEEIGIVKLVHTSSIQIDLFIHHRHKGQLLHGSRIHMWSNTEYGLIRRKLAGVEVLAPDNPDQYLRENYGEWEIPKTAFNCSTDTPNLTITQNFYALAFFIRKLLLHAQVGEVQNYHDTIRTLADEEALVSSTQLNESFFHRPLT
jgi:hypothetical protein